MHVGMEKGTVREGGARWCLELVGLLRLSYEFHRRYINLRNTGERIMTSVTSGALRGYYSW